MCFKILFLFSLLKVLLSRILTVKLNFQFNVLFLSGHLQMFVFLQNRAVYILLAADDDSGSVSTVCHLSTNPNINIFLLRTSRRRGGFLLQLTSFLFVQTLHQSSFFLHTLLWINDRGSSHQVRTNQISRKSLTVFSDTGRV